MIFKKIKMKKISIIKIYKNDLFEMYIFPHNLSFFHIHLSLNV